MHGYRIKDPLHNLVWVVSMDLQLVSQIAPEWNKASTWTAYAAIVAATAATATATTSCILHAAPANIRDSITFKAQLGGCLF